MLLPPSKHTKLNRATVEEECGGDEVASELASERFDDGSDRRSYVQRFAAVLGAKRTTSVSCAVFGVAATSG